MSDNLRKHGLGRGLSALLGDPPTKDEVARQSTGPAMRTIPIADVRPNPEQPRKVFEEEAIAELAESIVRHGVLQPILVRAVGGGFEIIAGERRWRAAQRAQLHEVPAIVRSDDESSRAELALIENVQRQDLNAIEEAEGYFALVEKYGHAQEVVANLVGKSRSHVTNLLRLLKLPDSVRLMLLRGELTMGHARALLTAPDPEAAARLVVAKGLSVRQTEALAKVGENKGNARPEPRGSSSVDADLAALERQLGDMLGLNVKVKHAGRGGTVSLAYSSLDQLDMICQRLSGEPI
jgi:ParB family chromosome partitioning protein